jgi:hypothetical protein
VIAVDVDIEESNLARIDPEQLTVQVTAPEGAVRGGLNMDQATALQREDQERRQSLWRWLLLGALALFLAETALSNWVSRAGAGAREAVAG